MSVRQSETIGAPTDVSPVGTPQAEHRSRRPKRYDTALRLLELRAVDPCVIACAVVEACAEIDAERGSKTADVAVRLMVAQLAGVCRASRDMKDYDELVSVCRLRADGW